MIEKYSDIRFGHGLFAKERDNIVYDIPDFELLKTLTFNNTTKFVDNKLAKHLIEYGKNVPLGVNSLHKKGINGEGVNVAIIDQPLALDHPEYASQIVDYKEFKPKDDDLEISSMHGPAVMSLLAGQSIGVAPKSNVFYCACYPSLLGDSKYYADALEYIIKKNKQLSHDEKIKFVSVSAAPSGEGSPFTLNQEMWDKAVYHANEEGILVVDCSRWNGFVLPGFLEYKDNKFQRGFPNREFERKDFIEGKIFAPTSLRTVAESYDNKHFGYTYCGVGGLSWGIPYITGLLCLGQQVNSQLTAKELKECLLTSSYNNIPNPINFITSVENILKHSTKVD